MERFKRIQRFAKSFMAVLLIITFLSIGQPAHAETPETADALALIVNLLENVITRDASRLDDTTYEAATALIRAERAAKIEAYFDQWNRPAADYAMDFVIAAEKHDIDWRLLPAIARAESSGFHNECDNGKNGFGYGGCDLVYPTYSKAIDVVAWNLGGHNPRTESYYKGKTLDQILVTYNPPNTPGILPGYHGKIKRWMNDIEEMEVSSARVLALNQTS